jgi:hypothetical protein
VRQTLQDSINIYLASRLLIELVLTDSVQSSHRIPEFFNSLATMVARYFSEIMQPLTSDMFRTPNQARSLRALPMNVRSAKLQLTLRPDSPRLGTVGKIPEIMKSNTRL